MWHIEDSHYDLYIPIKCEKWILKDRDKMERSENKINHLINLKCENISKSALMLSYIDGWPLY